MNKCGLNLECSNCVISVTCSMAAQQKAEEAHHSLQQLKAEIAALVTETSDFTKFGSNCEIVQYLHSKMRQLSTV